MSNDSPARCSRCQGVLPPGLTEVMCPSCLLAQAQSPPAQAAERPNDPQATEATPPGKFETPSLDELTQVFPQWEILNEIGRGGMGAVYRVRQRSLDRVVALKILPRQVAADPTFAERFTREAQTLARLNHPNIVTVHEAGQSQGLYYLLMEFVDGVNLRAAMQAQSLAPNEALTVIQQICEALQFAHDAGVVHRDIKPENILLDPQGHIKIADFGLAKLVHGTTADITLTHTHQVMGTWNYMAPEQVEQPLAVDHRADIYALGVIFYELLTGEVPRGRFKPPSARAPVDARLDQVVLRALEREPNERFQHAYDLSSAVSAISDHPQPAAPPTTPAATPTPEFPPHAAAAAAPLAATPTRPLKPAAPWKPTPAGGDALPLADVHQTLSLPTAPWHPGMLVQGAMMAALGGTMHWSFFEDASVMMWLGIGLTIAGFGTMASAFKPREPGDQRANPTWSPEPSRMIGGSLFTGLGIVLLLTTQLDRDAFTWLGIGLVLAGAGIVSSAWNNDVPRQPICKPRLDQLLTTVGLLGVGIALLCVQPLNQPQMLTWVGIGLFLAGAGTSQSIWLEESASKCN